MDTKFYTRVVVTLVLLVLAVGALWSTLRMVSLGPEGRADLELNSPDAFADLKAKAISLGLDLQGGMHMVLEVDTTGRTEEEAWDDYVRAIEVIRNRIDEFGVEEPIIQPLGEGRILVQLAGVDDPERAKSIVRRTAFLEFKLVAESSRTYTLLQAIDETVAKANAASLDPAVAGEESGAVETVDPLNPSAPDESLLADASLAEADSSMDALFGALDEGLDGELDDPSGAEQPFLSLLHIFPRREGDIEVVVPEENLRAVEAMLAMPQVADLMPDDFEFRLGVVKSQTTAANPFERYAPLYFLQREAELTGAAIEFAGVDYNTRRFNEPVVSLAFKSDYVKRFAEITGENIGRQLAIILDGKVRSAPYLNTRIPNGRSQIEGNFEFEEANEVAMVLRSGALPAPIHIVEERTVGSTLGHDSIDAGTNAGLFGLAFVLVFMLIYYRASGVIANLVLLTNVIFILGGLAMFGATLTLPGIAGIVLTMGMAVDANVLIFERIREEFRTGKSVIASIQAGYERAFTTIIDANITTFLTGLILFYYGSGPIRGFAVTLMIGIVTSLITAVYSSRVGFDFLYSTGRLRRLSI